MAAPLLEPLVTVPLAMLKPRPPGPLDAMSMPTPLPEYVPPVTVAVIFWLDSPKISRPEDLLLLIVLFVALNVIAAEPPSCEITATPFDPSVVLLSWMVELLRFSVDVPDEFRTNTL